MQFRMTPQKGDVVTFTMAVDGKETTLVNDPNHESGPVESKDWIEAHGGTAPLLKPKGTLDDEQQRGLAGLRDL